MIQLATITTTQQLSRRDRAAQQSYANTRFTIHAPAMAEAKNQPLWATIIRTFGW